MLGLEIEDSFRSRSRLRFAWLVGAQPCFTGSLDNSLLSTNHHVGGTLLETKDFPVRLGRWVLSRGGCQPAGQASLRGWLLQWGYVVTVGIQGVPGRGPDDARHVEISRRGEGVSEDPQMQLTTLWAIWACPSPLPPPPPSLPSNLAPCFPSDPTTHQPLPSGQSNLYKYSSDQVPPWWEAPSHTPLMGTKACRSVFPTHTPL